MMRRKARSPFLKKMAAGLCAFALVFSGTGTEAFAAAPAGSAETSAGVGANYSEPDFIPLTEAAAEELPVFKAAPSKAVGGVRTRSVYSNSYYYDHMSADEQALYNRLYVLCESYLNDSSLDAEYESGTASDGTPYSGYFTKGVEFSELTKDEIFATGYAFANSNPQFYYLAADQILYFSSNPEGRGDGTIMLRIYSDFADGSQRASYTARFNTKVASYMAEVLAQNTAYGRIKAAHDVLARNLYYDESNSRYNQSSAGAILENYTVCAGYAEGLEMLLNGAGINCITVTSSTHEWNEVYMGGTWYAVDLTWDDSTAADGGPFAQIFNNFFSDTQRSPYFLVSDETLLNADRTHRNNGAHTVESRWEVLQRPACSVDYSGDGSETASFTASTPGTFEYEDENTSGNGSSSGGSSDNGNGGNGGSSDNGNGGNGGSSDNGNNGNNGGSGNGDSSDPDNGDSSTDESSLVTVFRLYNPASGEHLYTTNTKEVTALRSMNWIAEGIGWYGVKRSDHPVYRLFNPNSGEHFYTLDVSERNSLVQKGWRDEGIGWYVVGSSAYPVFRAYNPNQRSNNHNYTTSYTEQARLILLGWRNEGTAWYSAAAVK